MATKDTFYYETYNDCDKAYEISDNGLIRYEYAPGQEVEINWHSFEDWHDKWEGYTDEEIDEIKKSEEAIHKDSSFPWRTPDFYDPSPVVDYKILVWCLTYNHCYKVYAVKHSTADDVEKFHRFADLYDSEDDEADEAIEDFIDSTDNGNFLSLLLDCFGERYPRKDELLEVKEGDVYYIEIDW